MLGKCSWFCHWAGYHQSVRYFCESLQLVVRLLSPQHLVKVLAVLVRPKMPDYINMSNINIPAHRTLGFLVTVLVIVVRYAKPGAKCGRQVILPGDCPELIAGILR